MIFAIQYPPRTTHELIEYHERVYLMVRVDNPVSGIVAISLRVHEPHDWEMKITDLHSIVFDVLEKSGVISDVSEVNLLTIAKCSRVTGGMIVVEITRIEDDEQK